MTKKQTGEAGEVGTTKIIIHHHQHTSDPKQGA